MTHSTVNIVATFRVEFHNEVLKKTTMNNTEDILVWGCDLLNAIILNSSQHKKIPWSPSVYPAWKVEGKHI